MSSRAMIKKQLLYGFYRFLHPLVAIALRIFYRRITLTHGEFLQQQGPFIYVSNHPNTLIDPFMVAIHSSRILHFLANAGLFDSRFGFWFFSTFYCFPIQRSIDKVSRQINNNHSFDRMAAFLAGGGVLFVAPEGGSEVGRYIKPLRTGTARVALNTAAGEDWQTELAILPVGLVYEAPFRFRSRVWVNVGEPIRVAAYREAYEADPFQAVRQLTDETEARLKNLTLDTPDEEEALLLDRLAQILYNLYPADFPTVVEKIKGIQQNWTSRAPGEIKRVGHYFSELALLDLSDLSIQQWQRGPYRSFAAMVLGFPLFLWGLLNNLLIVLLAELPLKLTGIYPTYHGTVRFLAGFFGVLLFYPVQYLLVAGNFGFLFGVAYLSSLIPSGLFAAFFVRKWKTWLELLRVRRMITSHPDKLASLKKDRQSIIADWQL